MEWKKIRKIKKEELKYLFILYGITPAAISAKDIQNSLNRLVP